MNDLKYRNTVISSLKIIFFIFFSLMKSLTRKLRPEMSSAYRITIYILVLPRCSCLILRKHAILALPTDFREPCSATLNL